MPFDPVQILLGRRRTPVGPFWLACLEQMPDGHDKRVVFKVLDLSAG